MNLTMALIFFFKKKKKKNPTTNVNMTQVLPLLSAGIERVWVFIVSMLGLLIELFSGVLASSLLLMKAMWP